MKYHVYWQNNLNPSRWPRGWLRTGLEATTLADAKAARDAHRERTNDAVKAGIMDANNANAIAYQIRKVK